MNQRLLVFFLLTLSTLSFADTHGKSMGAHVHGKVLIEVAVEGKTIDLSVDGPSESFVGFEHAPKTVTEKKAWSDAEALWEKELLNKLFTLDKKLGCKIANVSFKREMNGEHSDFEAEFKINCLEELKGQNMMVNVKKHFPLIKKLAIDLVGSETKTINISNNNQSIKL